MHTNHANKEIKLSVSCDMANWFFMEAVGVNVSPEYRLHPYLTAKMILILYLVQATKDHSTGSQKVSFFNSVISSVGKVNGLIFEI